MSRHIEGDVSESTRVRQWCGRQDALGFQQVRGNSVVNLGEAVVGNWTGPMTKLD